jgi:H+/Cl- antiporter ClcA
MMIPAIVAVVGGVGASAFFFYPPIYDFRDSEAQLLDLPLFVIVAAVTGQLATLERATQRKGVRIDPQRYRRSLSRH